ncbi:ferredoxin [Candidatus Sumerlaeota bacterium]|nr:ferredoxin [Candidatus Sumerlaeota bacterium]
MADNSAKVPENVPGKWYIDTNCIFCSSCVDVAPDNIKDGDEYSYVFKQPENEAEEEALRKAMEECPTDSIGDDGE